jgi:predicted benzoate:H+ symporter BenE
MISQPIEKDGVVHYYVGVLVAMMTMIVGLLAACLIGLWRTLPCSEADMKYKVIGCGILGQSVILLACSISIGYDIEQDAQAFLIRQSRSET